MCPLLLCILTLKMPQIQGENILKRPIPKYVLITGTYNKCVENVITARANLFEDDTRVTMGKDSRSAVMLSRSLR